VRSSFFVHSLLLEDGGTVDRVYDSDDKDGNCSLDYDSHSEQVASSRDTTFLLVAIMICRIETRMCKL